MPAVVETKDIPELTGKVAIVTGGTSGIGLHTANLLAQKGAVVHIASRNPEKCAKVLSDLRERFPEHASRFLIHPLDLSSIRSASESACAFVAENSRLDIIVANAGIGFVAVDKLSADGCDPVFATNHLGHFAFVMGLLPLVERTASEVGDARIVVVSSLAYNFVSGLDLSDVGDAKPGDGRRIGDLPDAARRYGRSKRANILFAMELHRRLVARGVQNVMVNVCHPGVIGNTGLVSDSGFGVPSWLVRFARWIASVVGLTPEEGAMTQVWLATAPQVRESNLSGRFYEPHVGWNFRFQYPKERNSGGIQTDEKSADELWKFTENAIEKSLVA